MLLTRAVLFSGKNSASGGWERKPLQVERRKYKAKNESRKRQGLPTKLEFELALNYIIDYCGRKKQDLPQGFLSAAGIFDKEVLKDIFASLKTPQKARRFAQGVINEAKNGSSFDERQGYLNNLIDRFNIRKGLQRLLNKAPKHISLKREKQGFIIKKKVGIPV